MAARDSRWLTMAQNGSKSDNPLKNITKVPKIAIKLKRKEKKEKKSGKYGLNMPKSAKRCKQKYAKKC